MQDEVLLLLESINNENASKELKISALILKGKAFVDITSKILTNIRPIITNVDSLEKKFKLLEKLKTAKRAKQN